MKHSEETKRKISESMKGTRKGERNPMFGRVVSNKTRRKISEANKGEKNGFFNKRHSSRTKKKISENINLTTSIIIHDCHTGKEIEFISLIKGYEYLKSIGVNCSQSQYSDYLVRMAKGLEPANTRATDLYRYKAKFK